MDNNLSIAHIYWRNFEPQFVNVCSSQQYPRYAKMPQHIKVCRVSQCAYAESDTQNKERCLFHLGSGFDLFAAVEEMQINGLNLWCKLMQLRHYVNDILK